jgi:hypothetical protein
MGKKGDRGLEVTVVVYDKNPKIGNSKGLVIDNFLDILAHRLGLHL